MSNDEIIPIWQPLGFSTHQIAKKSSEKFGKKGTHTGTLDPLAEGVIILLLGDTRLKKIELAGWKKTYEFEIAFGVSTDSFDAMGYFSDIDLAKPRVDGTALREITSSLRGPYVQSVPIYSAVKFMGKRLFEYAHGGNIPQDLPTKSGEIYELDYLGCREVVVKEAVTEIISKIRSIEGQFRQENILNQWENYFRTLTGAENFSVAKFRVVISRGMYVRALSQDICSRLESPGFVYSLVRTQNGNYTRKDCVTLDDIFGKNFDRSLLVSHF